MKINDLVLIVNMEETIFLTRAFYRIKGAD